MDMYSWFRRSLSRNNKNQTPHPPHDQINKTHEAEAEGEEVLGVTDQLIDFIKSFTLDTFKNFPLQDDEGANGSTTSGNVQMDLSEWQQRHATLVLSKVKEISQLRYMLCPRHLKERQFWRIYFMLVKSYVAEYELCAIRLATLKRIAMENVKSSNTSACEVEMAEAKQATSVVPLPTAL